MAIGTGLAGKAYLKKLSKLGKSQVGESGLTVHQIGIAAHISSGAVKSILAAAPTVSLRSALRFMAVLGIPASLEGAPLKTIPAKKTDRATKAVETADAAFDDVSWKLYAGRLANRMLIQQFGQNQQFVRKLESGQHNASLVKVVDHAKGLGLSVDTLSAPMKSLAASAGRLKKAGGAGNIDASFCYTPAEIRLIRAAWVKLNKAAAKEYLSVFIAGGGGEQSLQIGTNAAPYKVVGGFEYPPIVVSFASPKACSAQALVKSLSAGTAALGHLTAVDTDRNWRRRLDRQARQKWEGVDRKKTAKHPSLEIGALAESLFPEMSIKVDMAQPRPKQTKSGAVGIPPPRQIQGEAKDQFELLKNEVKASGLKLHQSHVKHGGGWALQLITHPASRVAPKTVRAAKGPVQTIPLSLEDRRIVGILETFRRRVIAYAG